MKPAQGFTLVEMAVVLAIIALLLAGLLVPLTSQVEQRQISDTQRSLEEIKEALTGFAVANGYLPCPAISATNGLEDRTAGVCTAGKREGFIPWATLGVSKLDAWGHVFRYSVTPDYARTAPPFAFTTGKDISVQTRDATGTLIPLTNANSIPAIVLSHGKNGYGSVDDQGIVQQLPPAWQVNQPDEYKNYIDPILFVSRVPQAAGATGPGGEFDDIVVWLSPNILFNRMVAAGKLP